MNRLPLSSNVCAFRSRLVKEFHVRHQSRDIFNPYSLRLRSLKNHIQYRPRESNHG